MPAVLNQMRALHGSCLVVCSTSPCKLVREVRDALSYQPLLHPGNEWAKIPPSHIDKKKRDTPQISCSLHHAKYLRFVEG